MLNRREYVTMLGGSVVAVSGCASEGDESNGEQFIDTPEEVVSFQDVATIQEDAWKYWELSFERQTEVNYDFVVRSGPPIDAILFSSDEFSHFEDQERARYYESASVLDSQGDRVEATLASGDYVLVLDNSNWGTAPPTNLDDDIAKVEVEFSAVR